jgi:AcrR family transcriptional regulator
MRSRTKTAILDVAEALFAEGGYKNTSLREITGRAGVNIAAVNYHFGSKLALLDAVFARRLGPLNEERLVMLGHLATRSSRTGKRPSTKEVLEAFMLPVLSFLETGEGSARMSVLIGRAISESDPVVRDIFGKMMQPVFSLSFRLLRDSLPELTPEQVFIRFNLALGAMSRGMCLAGEPLFLPEGVPAPPGAGSV